MARLFCYGDHVDTDRIIPGKYTKTLDRSVLKAHCFEDIDPSFSSEVSRGDIVVAGVNFGCGSSREQAAIAIKESGVQLVVAKSFARIFFRNAINVGLTVLEVPNHKIEQDSVLQYDAVRGVLKDLTYQKKYSVTALPGFLMDILESGGLVKYLKVRDGFDLNERGRSDA